MTDTKPTNLRKPPGYQEASGGDRGEAGNQNLEQSRAIGQDDPAQGSRMGREAGKASGDPGTPGTEPGHEEASDKDPGTPQQP